MKSIVATFAAAVLVLTTSVGMPTAAHAASTAITDPAGDGSQGAKLDITAATLANKAKAVKVTVEVAKVASGQLLVYLKAKGKRAYVVASAYDAKEGTLENVLLFGGPKKPVKCKGINAAWSTSENTISVRVPARCLYGGEYDKLRFKLLSERPTDGDNDFAPTSGEDDSTWTYSGYVARG
jgi:hypothetical protein